MGVQPHEARLHEVPKRADFAFAQQHRVLGEGAALKPAHNLRDVGFAQGCGGSKASA